MTNHALAELVALLQNHADRARFAFIGRTLWGFLNGNLGIAKTYISEICNDYTQTLGFSIFQTVGGISS